MPPGRFRPAPAPKKKPAAKPKRSLPTASAQMQAGIEAAAIHRTHGPHAAHGFLARQNTHAAPPAGARGPVKPKPEPRGHAGGGGLAPLPQTAADLQAQVSRRLGSPATPGHYKDPHALARGLKTVTGIDLERIKHPVRAQQQDTARGRAQYEAFKRGEITLAQAQSRSPMTAGIFPGGGRIPGLGRLSRAGEEVAAAAPKRVVGPLTKAQSEKAAHEFMQKQVLPAAKRGAKTQRAAIREQRSERAQAALEAEAKAGGGEAGIAAFKSAMAGEYDKPIFTALREGTVNKADYESWLRTVDKHVFSENPKQNLYKRNSLKIAMQNAREYGATPRKHENILLEEVFGPKAIAGNRPLSQKALDVGNIPRAFETTLDVSFLARQAALVAASRPGIFAKGVAPTFKSLVREGNYEKANAIVRADPLYEQGAKDGLAFSDIGGDVRTHEEAFSSNYAEKLTGGKHSPVRASGRAYSAAGNFYRMAMYRHMIETAESEKKGILGHIPGFRGVSDVENPAVRRKIAETANTLTGRGSGGEKWEKAAPFLNNFLFSPRFLRARINMLNPFWYAKLDPVSRREAFRAIVRMTASMAVILEAAHYAGARVGVDPRNADFGKIRFGDTRVDIGAGFLPYIRLAAQEATGTSISSTTGKKTQLGSGFGLPNRLDIGFRFLQGKASPSASLGLDVLRGKTFTGTPLGWNLNSVKYEAFNKGVPLVVQDTIDAQRSHHSVPLTGGLYGLSALGFGVQTYAKRTPKAKSSSGGGGGSSGPKNPYVTGGASSGRNPYLPGGGSTGSNPYLP